MFWGEMEGLGFGPKFRGIHKMIVRLEARRSWFFFTETKARDRGSFRGPTGDDTKFRLVH